MAIDKLKGTLLYVSLQKPVKCYEQEKGLEWKASIVVDEDTADLWEELYNKQPAKRIKTEDFEATYKIPAPFPNERKQFIVTLRKNTLLANGNPVPDIYQPKVIMSEDGEYKDVTSSVLVGNGSIGEISVDHYDAKLGAVARLKNILVTDLVEYVETNTVLGSEFGLVSPAVKNTAKPSVKPEAKKTVVEPKKPAPKKPDTGFADMDDDAPF
jgi:hypothetical protein